MQVGEEGVPLSLKKPFTQLRRIPLSLTSNQGLAFWILPPVPGGPWSGLIFGTFSLKVGKTFSGCGPRAPVGFPVKAFGY